MTLFVRFHVNQRCEDQGRGLEQRPINIFQPSRYFRGFGSQRTVIDARFRSGEQFGGQLYEGIVEVDLLLIERCDVVGKLLKWLVEMHSLQHADLGLEFQDNSGAAPNTGDKLVDVFFRSKLSL